MQRHNTENSRQICVASFPMSHSCVCERFLYLHDLSAYSAAGKYVDRSWEYINRSQTRECRNWEWGRSIPFLEIHKWGFRCSATKRMVVYTIQRQQNSMVFFPYSYSIGQGIHNMYMKCVHKFLYTFFYNIWSLEIYLLRGLNQECNYIFI